LSDERTVTDRRHGARGSAPDGAAGGARRPSRVHGSRKRPEAGDPLELKGNVVPGDGDYLARCFVEEFAAMGHDAAAILELFRDPRYAAVYAVYRRRGEQAVRRLICDVLAECGVLQVTVTTPDRPPSSRLAQIEVPDDAEEKRR
jgi:hypothetical protein